MIGFENITKEVAADLIELVNQLRGLEKSAQVNYSVQNRKQGNGCTRHLIMYHLIIS